MEFFSVDLNFDSEIFIKLLEVSLIPIGLSLIFYLLKRLTKFDKLGFWPTQIIIGLAFGGAAIFGTEFGVDVSGATVNARDAAPLCAGLIFGAPAGIIAGVIGGVERWFAVLWGAGEFSRLACSISTILAGLFAAGLRRYLFDNKRPTWGIGAATAAVMEIIHLSLLFLLRLDNVSKAYEIITICTVPMVFVNALAVGVSIFLISHLSKGIHKEERGIRRISKVIQVRLLVGVAIAFFLTTCFVYALQTATAVYEAKDLLTVNITDIENEVVDSMDDELLDSCYKIKLWVDSGVADDLESLAALYEVDEVNVVDKNGIITESTNPDFVGFDMSSGEQSAEFLCLNEGTREYTQLFGAISYDSEMYRKYAGMSLQRGGFIQVGYDTDSLRSKIDVLVDSLTANRHIGSSGYLVIADEKGNIVSTNGPGNSKTLEEAGIEISDSVAELEMFSSTIYEYPCICMYGSIDSYHVVSVLTTEEVFSSRNAAVLVNTYMEVLVFAMLFIFIYLLIKRHVVDKIMEVNSGLSKISAGNLDTVVDVHSSTEFASLSKDINQTVDTLKQYIAEAAARIDKELAFAKSIQIAALPTNFQDNEYYGLYATMNTAKEVGGDFYDFYELGDGKVAFLIADVSGKGIPAAMFMMQSKTMIKNLAEENIPINEVMTTANNRLCETNEAGMFVTTWLGFLDLKTGHVVFVNAGHNPPLMYTKAEDRYEYMHSKVSLVLAGMEGINYRMQEFDMQPGDKLYLYTDGVTEATDANNELYGEDRLSTYLNAHTTDGLKDTLLGVKADVDEFVGEAEQFDDITMLSIEFKNYKK